MSQEPQIRALAIQTCLDAIDALDNALGAAVLERLPRDCVPTVRRASRMTWLDAQLQIQINEALFSNMDEAAYDLFWRDVGVRMAKAGAIAGLVQGAMRILGVEPRGLYKMLPRAAAHTTRGMGLVEAEVHQDGLGATIRYSELPAMLRQTNAYLYSTRATLMVPLRVLEVEGSIELDQSEVQQGRAAFRVRWVK